MKVHAIRFSILFCFLFFSFNSSFVGADQGYSDLSPVSQTEESGPAEKYVETFRFNIKAGVRHQFTFGWEKKIWQLPVLLELKVPVLTTSGNIKWLIQLGGGWMQMMTQGLSCSEFFYGAPPKPPEPPFDSEFFQKIYRNHLQEYKEETEGCFFKEWHIIEAFPYVTAQTGLQYDFKSLTLALLGGVMGGFGGLDTGGWMGRALIGLKMSDVFYLEAGADTLYYGDFYWGFSLSLGFTLKKWWEKLPSF